MKKFLAIILTFVLCFGVLSVALAAEDEPATAVPDGYIGIYTAEDLDNIRNNLSGKYILMNNIDLSSYENWSPIGTSETPFTGELDGNGYVIKNMKIHKEFTDGEEPCLGLFSSINSAEIINLLLLGVDIKASFAGETPESFGIGSVSGYAKGATFESCITSGAITIDGFNEGFAGGISGTGISSELTNCVNNTKINLLSENVYDICIGGIFGRGTRTTISHSVNSGDITVRGIDYDKKERMLKIGGLAADFGNFHLVLNDCYNKGNISLDFSIPSAYVGGIMGNGFLIKQCYNVGKITVPETFSGCEGGISGNFPEGWLASVPSPNIINSYYNNKDFYPTYIGEESSPSDDYFTNVKYLTPEEMKSQESFVGFDFNTVWEMEENGYPILRNMPVIPETEKPGVTKPTTTTEPKTTKPDAAVPDGYIGIYTAEDLNNVRNNLSGKYILMNNIDLSSHENWTPIGTSGALFLGEFDGNGYAIENMTITATKQDALYVGLFGQIGNSEIKNLKIKNGKIFVHSDSGIRAGLLCGSAGNARILNCESSGEITTSSGKYNYTGGLVGFLIKSETSNNSYIKNCTNYATVCSFTDYTGSQFSPDCFTGGLVGYSYSDIEYCSNYGNVSSDFINNSFFFSFVGGVSGGFRSNINNCYNTAIISSSNNNIFAGGVSGYWMKLQNISCIFNIGEINVVASKDYYIDALIGFNDFMASLADSEESEDYYLNYGYYINDVNSTKDSEKRNVRRLTPEEFKKQESFIGFDFDNVWEMDYRLGHPVLKWVPAEPSLPSTEPATKITTILSTTSVAEPVTEESATLPITTSVEPSTSEPATKENTTVPVATPVEPSTTEPVTEPSTGEITTVKSTELVTNPVTEPSTSEITTQPITEPTTIPVIESSTTQPNTEKEPTSEPSTTGTTEPSSVTTTETSTEPDDGIGILAWLIKVIKMIIDWFVKLFVMLGC